MVAKLLICNADPAGNDIIDINQGKSSNDPPHIDIVLVDDITNLQTLTLKKQILLLGVIN